MSEFVKQHAQNQSDKGQKGAYKRQLQSRIQELEQDEKAAIFAVQACRRAEFLALTSST
jgi:hypothetical protein